VYLSWNKRKEITKEYVIKIYEKFIEEIGEKSWLRIGFNTGELCTGMIQRVAELAEKYRLEH
jgi:hypothetical protein